MTKPAVSRKEQLARRATSLILRIAEPIVRLLTQNRRVNRSLWAGVPILTLPVKAKAERLLGVKADTLVFETYYITSEFKFNLSRWNRGPVVWRRFVLPLLVLLWASLRYQRFHFFCSKALLPGDPFAVREDEMAYLAGLGKQLFFYTYGADVRTRRRTRALGEPNCCTACPEPGKFCVCDDDRGAELQGVLRNYATAIFALGDMVHYTPCSRNDLFFWPIDLNAEDGKRYEPRYPDANSTQPIRIAHAPNHQGFKGTPYLVSAVKRLQEYGVPVELDLVERVPNRVALEIYRRADIVFDQCLIGFHGYFALEAMAMGKPVVVFIRDPERDLLAPDECPFVNVRPETVERVLFDLIQDRGRLNEFGRQGRRYIERHYSVEAFAGRLRRTYQELGVS
jgi:glycosyltransferase involved in cell wall biosynthesis